MCWGVLGQSTLGFTKTEIRTKPKEFWCVWMCVHVRARPVRNDLSAKKRLKLLVLTFEAKRLNNSRKWEKTNTFCFSPLVPAPPPLPPPAAPVPPQQPQQFKAKLPNLWIFCKCNSFYSKSRKKRFMFERISLQRIGASESRRTNVEPNRSRTFRTVRATSEGQSSTASHPSRPGSLLTHPRAHAHARRTNSPLQLL